MIEALELAYDRPVVAIVAIAALLPVAAAVADGVFGQPRNSNGEYAPLRLTEVKTIYRLTTYLITIGVLALAYWKYAL